MGLKAVAFDIDGTLYSNATMYLRSLGFALANVRLLAALKKVRDDLRLVRDGGDIHRVQAALVARELGWTEERALSVIEKRIYGDWEASLLGIPLVPGLIETLKLCREQGLKLGLLSDFPVDRKIGILGLEGWWDFAITSEVTGFLKPHPEPFRALADGLGCEPSTILYVGDSWHSDVLGAKNADMKVAHCTRKPRKNSPADLSFHKQADLRAWILANL